MSRKTQATLVEDFDDDTELPLPSRPLPNTGSRGALIQSISDDEEDEEDDEEEGIDMRMDSLSGAAGPASPSQGAGFGVKQQAMPNTVADLTPYKKWTCIYPIYIDAKRPFGTGLRRVSRAKSVWWPLSKDIAEAASRLGLGTLHEVHKSHPRDWDNPGRVRVQIHRDGHLVNNNIKSKKHLLEAISFYIQTVKPELIPREPYTYAPPSEPPKAKTSSTNKQKQIAAKSKGKDKGKATASSASTKGLDVEAEHITGPRGRLPQPPTPWPPLASRVSAFSPSLPSGVLVDAIKAGMSAAAAENAALPPGMGGKGKRKVLRVRG